MNRSNTSLRHICGKKKKKNLGFSLSSWPMCSAHYRDGSVHLSNLLTLTSRFSTAAKSCKKYEKCNSKNKDLQLRATKNNYFARSFIKSEQINFWGVFSGANNLTAD